MTGLHDVLQAHVDSRSAPGLVALIARGDRIEVQVAGFADAAGSRSMARDSIFRIASMSKPIVAAAAMTLIDDGRMTLADPVARWLPELASPSVLRTLGSPVEDVVPALRPITVYDLLSSRAGHGFPSDFSLPVVRLLLELGPGTSPGSCPPPDEWLARLARIPMLSQPGEAWLYNTSSDILGVLIARVAGRPLPGFLEVRLFEPPGMLDTGFEVPVGKLDRFTSLYGRTPAGEIELIDAPDGQWSRPPAFPSHRAVRRNGGSDVPRRRTGWGTVSLIRLVSVAAHESVPDYPDRVSGPVTEGASGPYGDRFRCAPSGCVGDD
ncbi:MAG: serine hydrolase domain-containing protein [Jatrophihabitantaceae bacterium]